MKRAVLILCAILSTAGAKAQDRAPPVPQPRQADLADAAFDQAVQAVRDKDFRRAVDLFLPLASAGAADAQFNLALLLKLGRGRPQTYRDAYYWAALSLLGGEARAQDLVAALQAALPDKEREAVVKQLQELLRNQIESADTTAPEKLARLYADFAIKPDLESAFMWFSICYALGKADCQAGMARSSQAMAPETLVKAQAAAAEVFAASAFSKP